MKKRQFLTFFSVVLGLVIGTLSAAVQAWDSAPTQAEPSAEAAPAGAELPGEAEAPPAAADEDEAFLNEPQQPAETEAKAQQEDTPDAEEQPRKLVRDHYFQGFVNVFFGTGWYFVAPYDKDDPDKRCADWEDPNAEELTAPAICTGRSAWHFDFLGGFGIRPGFEVFVMFRLGVTEPSEFASNPRMIGAGLKVYTPNDGLFKIGFGVAPMFDFSSRYGDIGNDFLIHVPVLAQFDIVRWFGAYVQAAPNISFVTEFKIDITAGIGVQGRFP